MPKEKLEKEVEKKCLKMIHEQRKCLILKGFERNYPDRLILLPEGRAVFIEFKREGEKLRIQQNYIKALLEQLGFEVYVISDESQFAELLSRL